MGRKKPKHVQGHGGNRKHDIVNKHVLCIYFEAESALFIGANGLTKCGSRLKHYVRINL